MKFYWCKDKCGDRAIVITEHDLIALIEDTADNFFFGGKNGLFNQTFDDIIKHLKKCRRNSPQYFRRFCFGRMASYITKEAGNLKLSCPFEHIKEEEMQQHFYRNKNGELKP